MKNIFWLSFIFIIYSYFGYPLLLWLLSRFVGRIIDKHPITPSVSVVIAVFNEKMRICHRLDNLLAQKYSAQQFEILVVSDGSTDGTNEIVKSYCDRNVKLLELTERKGKAVAVNEGVAAAQGEIIVFADARQQFDPEAISQLVANFHDPSVGCVSGELMFMKDTDSTIQAEMGAYWSYEIWIRKAESKTGSVVGATGAIYAVRRALYRPLPEGTLLDDVLTPLNVVMQGRRCVFDGTAVAYDAVSKDAAQEWKRKVRTLAGNWQLLSLSPMLALPLMNPIWWRFISHKICRLLVPFALVGMFLCGVLAGHLLYSAATAVQTLFYMAALAGLIFPVTRSLRLINLSYFFMVMNAAAVAGMWRWITGGCKSSWNITGS